MSSCSEVDRGIKPHRACPGTTGPRALGRRSRKSVWEWSLGNSVCAATVEPWRPAQVDAFDAEWSGEFLPETVPCIPLPVTAQASPVFQPSVGDRVIRERAVGVIPVVRQRVSPP